MPASDLLTPAPPQRSGATTATAPPPADWLRALRERRLRSRGEIQSLTEQFYGTLRASASAVESRAAEVPAAPLARVRLLLTRGIQQPTWQDAYEIEQQLVHLVAPEVLEPEIRVRLTEARLALGPEKARTYDQVDLAQLSTAEQRRSLLGRLINDLQWAYTLREAKRDLWRQVTNATAWFFAVFGALFLVLLLYVANRPMPEGSSAALQGLLLSPGPLALALAAGAWGATFSMLLGLKKSELETVTLDQLKVMGFLSVFLARIGIGAGGALVFVFFLVGGFLSGTVFPDLRATPADAAARTTGLVLLVLWCFVAGFSEKLVPSLLKKSERQAGAAEGERQPGEVDAPRGKGKSEEGG